MTLLLTKKYGTRRYRECLREKWMEARGKVLDIGNKQIKDLKEEFKQYTMNWDRYQYEIRFIPKDF